MVASLPSPPSPVLQPRRLHLISGNSNRLSSPSSSAVCYFNICCRRSQILLQKSQKLTGFIKAHVQSPFQFWDYNRYGRSKNQINIRQGAVIWSSFSLQLRKVHSFSSQCWLLLVNYSYLKLGEYAISLLKLRTWQWKVKLGFSVLVTQLAMCIMIIASVSVPLTATPSWALTEENLLFLEAWRTIDRAYFDKTFNGQSWFRYREEALRNEPMNTREETYAAIRKMLATLNDPFTRFLEPEKFKSLRSGTQGALTGVGMSIGYPFGVVDESSSMGGLAVISSAPEGPANRAGIMSGDVILAIDGMSTESMGLYDAAERLQGPEGSVVELAIRSGPSEIRHISLKREKVTLNPVKSKLCEVSSFGNEPSTIGYIKLTTFNQNASGAVKEAIETLRRKNVKSFVLDLRNNSGGLFPEGIEIAKIWLQKGVIVYICDSRGVRDIYETDGSSAIAASEPLVVLVNKGTASASEILAGALKDNGRALLFGEPTYGKGKIQSVFELSDGSGLAVTVARYQTPALNDIDKVGVIPDHPLPKSFPMDGDGFCDCLKYPSSCNLNTTKLFLRVLLKERASRILPESQSGYLEDLDQAPDEEIQELARVNYSPLKDGMSSKIVRRSPRIRRMALHLANMVNPKGFAPYRS